MEAGDEANKKYPTAIEVDNCNFTLNMPLIDALFKLRTNTQLIIKGSLFKDNYSVSRGGIILADYEQVEATVYNSTFESNFAFDGGIFFAHYGSHVRFEEC